MCPSKVIYNDALDNWYIDDTVKAFFLLLLIHLPVFASVLLPTAGITAVWKREKYHATLLMIV